jgi:methyl-accepting chemotaxis protein
MKKDMKLMTKLMIGFGVIDVLVILTILSGYSTAKQLLKADDPERYVLHYRTFTVILFIAAMVVMAVIASIIIGGVRNSVKTLEEAGTLLAAGKVDVDLKKNHNDEIGAVIDQFQQVIKNIRYQAGVAEEVAEGNLMVDVKLQSEDDQMGKSLNKLVDRNLHALRNIQEGASQVMVNSTEVAGASEALAQGSTEQASAIQQITASMDDIAEKTRCNAEKANEAQALVAEAIADVKDGNEAMRNMILAMNEINASSESISKIIKVIDDIAFQTNILALNAAVEAARAGEAGKGFAVVAEEVRNLAAKSSQAASETAELIENSIRKVETGSGIADGTAKALEKITGNVEKSQVLINDIAEASNYQADAIEQIGLAVEQVSQVVQNNSATSEECAASSVDLANQANRMQELLAVYNLGTPRAAYQNAGGRNSEYNEQIISLKDGYNRY